MSEQKYTLSEVDFSSSDNSKPRCQMNDRTLAQEMAWIVKLLEDRSDCEDFGDKARNRFGVARNLVAQAITETKYAAKYAAQYAGSVKEVSK